jgi:dihydrofolate synthase/folylpolyglutamate synthase
MLHSLSDWQEFINRQHGAEIVMGLDRVAAVWARLGKPQAPRHIMVGGTNGKGSTAAMLESILRSAGYRTGFYSSPHLLRFNERFRIDATEVDDGALMAALSQVETARHAGEPIALTYFEYATLACLVLFQRAALDVAILEVGMGGRLDAVNLVDADVSIVTSVDLDHQQYLGDTREAIGFEKAHIYRAGRVAIFGERDMPQTVAAYAEKIGARLQVLGRDYDFTTMEQQWQWRAQLDGNAITRHALPYPALRGRYQLANASAALMALAALQGALPVTQDQVKRGLLGVEWPGRMQVLPGRPTIVLDVAHNPHAARALDDALGGMAFHPNTYAVFSMLRDKDIDRVITTLAHRIDHWFIAGLTGERGLSAAAMAERFAGLGLSARVTMTFDVASAYAAARERATPDDRILVFGSFHTVAEVMKQQSHHVSATSLSGS